MRWQNRKKNKKPKPQPKKSDSWQKLNVRKKNKKRLNAMLMLLKKLSVIGKKPKKKPKP